MRCERVLASPETTVSLGPMRRVIVEMLVVSQNVVLSELVLLPRLHRADD